MKANGFASFVNLLILPLLSLITLLVHSPSAAAACSASSTTWVQKSYISYYGRPGDPAGIDYWACRMDDEGGNLSNIIDAFGVSAEFTDRYGTLSNSELIDSIYRQMFNRDPDAAGKQWYLDELTSGRMNLQTITLNVLSGATGTDQAIVANKLQLADYFSNALSAGSVTYRDIDLAKSVLDIVDEEESSLTQAQTSADLLVNLWATLNAQNSAFCSNTCSFAKDGACDDAGEGAQYRVCNIGTDCSDCGMRVVYAPCNDYCAYAKDGVCDDGGSNSEYNYCTLGSDCSDCGSRDELIPPPDPEPEPEPEPNPGDGGSDPEDPPASSDLPEVGIAVVTDSKNNKAVTAINRMGEGYAVLFDGTKPIGNDAILGAVYQTPEGTIATIEFNASGQATRMEVEGSVFIYSNYTSGTVDISITHADGSTENHPSVPLIAGTTNQEFIRRVAGRGFKQLDDGQEVATFAMGFIGTSISIVVCASAVAGSGGAGALLTLSCINAVAGAVGTALGNQYVGATSSSVDIVSSLAAGDKASLVSGLFGATSTLLGWESDQVVLKAAITGQVHALATHEPLSQNEEVETLVLVDSTDGDESIETNSNDHFILSKLVGPGSHTVRFEARGYITKEYVVAISDDAVTVGEKGTAPGEATRVIKEIRPTSKNKPVLLWLVPELEKAPRIKGHVVWPRQKKGGFTETEIVRGGQVWLEDAGSGAKAAWFAQATVASSDISEHGIGYYELYLPRKSGNYVLKLQQNEVCFQNVDIPVSISGSTASQNVSFDVPKAAFRDAETLNFSFNSGASIDLDIPVISVYNGRFSGTITPNEELISYTYPYESCSEEGCVTEIASVELECSVVDFHINLQDGAGTLESDGESLPVEIGQCGEINDTAYNVTYQGSLWNGGTLEDRDMEPGASRETGCSGRWTFPILQQ